MKEVDVVLFMGTELRDITVIEVTPQQLFNLRQRLQKPQSCKKLIETCRTGPQ